MFDVSFSELMLIGVIALIVIGPERLPKVARTIGHLVGRAQRYVNEVKSDIQKEIDLKDIGDLKNQMQDAARSVQSSMQESADAFKAQVEAPAQEVRDALDEARAAVDAPAADTLAEPASAAQPGNATAPARTAADAASPPPAPPGDPVAAVPAQPAEPAILQDPKQ